MIRNEVGHQESKRLAEELERLGTSSAVEAPVSEIEINRVVDQLESFHLQLREEIAAYKRLMPGEFESLENLEAWGLS